MPEIPVSADDITAVAMAWEVLSGSGAITNWDRVRALTIANQAIGRMKDAVTRAGSPLPDDPVSDTTEMAVTDRVLMDTYLGQGFGEDQAFALVHANVQARAQALFAARVAQLHASGTPGP